MKLPLIICILLVDVLLLALIISIHSMRKGIQVELDKISSSLKSFKDRLEKIEREHDERAKILTTDKVKKLEGCLEEIFKEGIKDFEDKGGE